MIYLDYSANTPTDPAVLDRFCRTEREFIGNPNSMHFLGKAALLEMNRVTCRIAALLEVDPSEIIYTSCASESNNTAIKGIARLSRHDGKHIISTPLEHSSVSGCLTFLQEQGYEIDLLSIKRDGTVDLEQFRELLRGDTILVSVCAVDSELGVIQPIAEIASILRFFPKCRLHVDATQAVGKTSLNFDGVDTLSFAPHKFYGLNGSGMLFKRKGLAIEPLIHGGTSTTIYRSGTPALALASAAEEALSLALSHQAEWTKHVSALNRLLRDELSRYDGVRINSPENAVPHILNISVEGIKANVFQRELDKEGICVSVKSACSTDGAPSRAVMAISHDRRNALSSWRISLSHLTTAENLSDFLEAFDICRCRILGL
ncbi:MAG: cysteine desulfurase family protein [Clostridiaceae bacterium]|nr:cysteine desulfurase family protein [Clostridiaceae bacterium]